MKTRKSDLDRVVDRLGRIREGELVPPAVIEFCLGQREEIGMSPEQARNLANDLERQAERVKAVGDVLVNLPSAMTPSGSIL